MTHKRLHLGASVRAVWEMCGLKLGTCNKFFGFGAPRYCLSRDREIDVLLFVKQGFLQEQSFSHACTEKQKKKRH